MNKTKFAAALVILFMVLVSCSMLKNLSGGDKLYFCEKYVTKEIGEGSKFPAGKITIMVKLSKPIGVSSVDINITDKTSGNAVQTVPFSVESNWDYIHFDDVEFKDPGHYKVSCLKKDGTVICTGEVEITK